MNANIKKKKISLVLYNHQSLYMSDSEVLLEFIAVTGCFVKYYDKKCSFMQGFADTVYIYLSVGNLAKIK